MKRYFSFYVSLLAFCLFCMLTGCYSPKSDAASKDTVKPVVKTETPATDKPVTLKMESTISPVATIPEPIKNMVSFEYKSELTCVEMSKTLEALVKNPPVSGSPKIVYMNQLKFTFPSETGTVQIDQTCYQVAVPE